MIVTREGRKASPRDRCESFRGWNVEAVIPRARRDVELRLRRLRDGGGYRLAV